MNELTQYEVIAVEEKKVIECIGLMLTRINPDRLKIIENKDYDKLKAIIFKWYNGYIESLAK